MLQEAWELVEHDLVEVADFRNFAFANIANLHGGMNPDFFEGTVVESDVAKLLGAKKREDSLVTAK